MMVLRWTAGLATAAALALAFPPVQAAPSEAPRPPFAANSPFNVPIPAGAKTDPRSDAYVARLTGGNVVANTTDYANAIYEATPSTPRLPLRIPNDSRAGGDWGHNALYGARVPVPAHAVPPAGTDGTVVVVDRQGGKT